MQGTAFLIGTEPAASEAAPLGSLEAPGGKEANLLTLLTKEGLHTFEIYYARLFLGVAQQKGLELRCLSLSFLLKPDEDLTRIFRPKATARNPLCLIVDGKWTENEKVRVQI